MSSWESTFETWSQGPSNTEQEKCDRAVNSIKRAIASDAVLSLRNVSTFAQGSYRNRTNIRLDSDVDVCVCCKDVFYPDYPSGTDASTFGNSSADYTVETFKNQVETALVNYFGRAAVTRGDKAFDIKANSYHVEADAVPAFEHRRYYLRDGSGGFHEGVEIHPDSGGKIINWPQQVYDNGVSKHSNTGRRYKKIIRILKNLRNKMQEDQIPEAHDVSSFLIECLVWNVPDGYFGNSSLTGDVRKVLAFLIDNLSADSSCSDWVEVSRLKWLFRSNQPWTRDQAFGFVCACWVYLEF